VLFDLQGKRRRVVQVVYATLAGLFLVGFVAFGIGSDVSGGFADLFGGGSGGSLSTQFDDQIDNANAQLAKNPDDTDALLNLARYEFFKAKQGVTQDQSTGQISVSEDAHTELGNSVDAWEKYLKLNKGDPNPSVAAQIVQAYYLLNDAGGAADAQEIVATDQPSSGSFGQLAFYRYASFDIPGGDEAAKKAVSMAPGSTRKTTQQQLDQIRERAMKAKKQAAKAAEKSSTAPGASPLQDPFGGLGAAP
jgi:hypothetical protein